MPGTETGGEREAVAAIVQAARLGLALPPATVPGVVAQLGLLADHHGVLRASLMQDAA